MGAFQETLAEDDMRPETAVIASASGTNPDSQGMAEKFQRTDSQVVEGELIEVELLAKITLRDKNADVVEPSFTNEDDFRKAQKVNSVATISGLRLKPHSISRLRIPLCRLVVMPMIRPALQCDLTRLEQDFVHGYRDGSSVFYVSLTNEQGEVEMVSDVEKESWGPLWNAENDAFNTILNGTPGLEKYQSSKFFVCDGNHRLLAWSAYIQHNHSNDRDWHISVDSIILEIKGKIGDVMHAMHDINQHTENSFIKTNLVHTLYRVQKYGVLPLDKFAEHLSLTEMAQCTSSSRKSWFTMSVEVFTSYFGTRLQLQRIWQCANKRKTRQRRTSLQKEYCLL